jgi:hypothetical protein
MSRAFIRFRMRSFEVAGDLSTSGRCAYYERARKLLEDRVPLLQGDQLTLVGRITPLPLFLASVHSKGTYGQAYIETAETVPCPSKPTAAAPFGVRRLGAAFTVATHAH